MTQFEHASVGDRVTIKATDYNGWQDAAAWIRSPRTIGRDFGPQRQKPGELLLRNSTGGDRKSFEVVAISESLAIDPDELLDDFKAQVYLSASAVTGEESRIAVLIEAGEDGDPILARVSGLVQVQLQVNDELDQYAQTIADDHTKLSSAAWGPARIWAKNHTTGDGWAIVEINAPPPTMVIGELDGAATYEDTDLTVSPLYGGSDITDVHWDEQGESGETLSDGAVVRVVWDDPATPRIATWPCEGGS